LFAFRTEETSLLCLSDRRLDISPDVVALQVEQLKLEYDRLGPYIDSCSRAAEDLQFADSHARLKTEIWTKLFKLGIVLDY